MAFSDSPQDSTPRLQPLANRLILAADEFAHPTGATERYERSVAELPRPFSRQVFPRPAISKTPPRSRPESLRR